MNKQLRMINTEYYKYTNVNPKDKYGGDCVVRAIALACGQTWEETVREMTEMGIKMGFVLIDEHVYTKYLLSKGFTQCKEPRDIFNRKMSIEEWIDEKQFYKGTIVVNAGNHHVTTVINGKVRDVWNCSGKTMHKYWRKEK